MAKGPQRKSQSSRRTRQAKAMALTGSSVDVAFIVREAGLEAGLSESIKIFLAELQADYQTQLTHLDWHATDKQIDSGLTHVRSSAAALSNALQSAAIKDALLQARVLTDQFSSTEKEEMERIAEKFDDDIAAVARLRDLARKALDIHDSEKKLRPQQRKLPTAAKPELRYLVGRIVDFWTTTLHRGISGETRSGLQKFTTAVIDQITGDVREETAIRALIRQALTDLTVMEASREKKN